MKRRSVTQPAAGEVPEHLLSIGGVQDFIDPAGGDSFARYLQAFHRWCAARKLWCVERGLDYVDTFHPEWRRP